MEVEAGLLADQVAAKEGSLSVDAVPERALVAFTKGVIVIEFAVASLEIDLKKFEETAICALVIWYTKRNNQNCRLSYHRMPFDMYTAVMTD